MKDIILKSTPDHIFPKNINSNMGAIIIAYSGSKPIGYIVYIGEAWFFTNSIDLTYYEDLEGDKDLEELLEYLERTHGYTFKLMEFY